MQIELIATASEDSAFLPRLGLGVLAALTVIVIYLSYLLVRPFMPALVWSITLAVVTHRFWRWITRYVPRPNLRAGIAVGTVAVALLAPRVGKRCRNPIRQQVTVRDPGQSVMERHGFEGSRRIST